MPPARGLTQALGKMSNRLRGALLVLVGCALLARCLAGFYTFSMPIGRVGNSATWEGSPFYFLVSMLIFLSAGLLTVRYGIKTYRTPAPPPNRHIGA